MAGASSAARLTLLPGPVCNGRPLCLFVYLPFALLSSEGFERGALLKRTRMHDDPHENSSPQEVSSAIVTSTWRIVVAYGIVALFVCLCGYHFYAHREDFAFLADVSGTGPGSGGSVHRGCNYCRHVSVEALFRPLSFAHRAAGVGSACNNLVAGESPLAHPRGDGRLGFLSQESAWHELR